MKWKIYAVVALIYVSVAVWLWTLDKPGVAVVWGIGAVLWFGSAWVRRSAGRAKQEHEAFMRYMRRVHGDKL